MGVKVQIQISGRVQVRVQVLEKWPRSLVQHLKRNQYTMNVKDLTKKILNRFSPHLSVKYRR